MYLSAEKIKSRLFSNGRVPRAIDVEVFESLSSTNDWALAQLSAGRRGVFVCFAEEQTQGRGRHGKQWLHGKGKNIAMTLCWPFAAQIPLSVLSVIIGQAVVRLIESLGLQSVMLKWPNDVYLASKKVAGILIETCPFASSEGRAGRYAVIGIGLNIDLSDLQSTCQQQGIEATDILSACTQQAVDGGHMLQMMSVSMIEAVSLACDTFPQNVVTCLNEINARYNYCQGKLLDVRFADGKTVFGIGGKIADDGSLQVNVNGENVSVVSAEVSVCVQDKATSLSSEDGEQVGKEC